MNNDGAASAGPPASPAARGPAGAAGAIEPGSRGPQAGDAQIVIERARRDDVAAIAALLRAAGLPHEDFAAHLDSFLVARRGGDVVGAIGAQLAGRDGLLRSLVVAPALRGTGLGDALVRRLEEAAGKWGVQHWWLLTTTAEGFFTRRGFRLTPRAEAPAAIAATAEFQALCPSVAACLSRERRTA